jgi:hypothetical protein
MPTTYLAVARQTAEIVLGLGVADGHLNLHSRSPPWPAHPRRLARHPPAPAPPPPSCALPEALAVETANAGTWTCSRPSTSASWKN